MTLRVFRRFDHLRPTVLKSCRSWSMRIPQELVDAIPSRIGAKYTHSSVVGELFHCPGRQCDIAELKSLASVPGACNHRARSHLFANCKVTNANPRSFEHFEQCPDVLLGCTRTPRMIHRCRNLTTILVTIRRCFIFVGHYKISLCPKGTPRDAQVGFLQCPSCDHRDFHVQPRYPHERTPTPTVQVESCPRRR